MTPAASGWHWPYFVNVNGKGPRQSPTAIAYGSRPRNQARRRAADRYAPASPSSDHSRNQAAIAISG